MNKDGRGFGLLVFVAAMLFGAGVSLWFGKLILWDLRSYHYYSAHVLWTGGVGVDIATGASGANPVPYLPFYGLVRTLPDYVVGGTLGALHGLSAWLLFCIGRICLVGVYAGVSRRGIEGLAVLSALFGVSGPMFGPLIGSSSADITSGLFVCAGLVFLLGAPRGREGRWHCGGAALAIGLATGAKLTNSIYVIAFAVVFLMWRAREKDFLRTLVAVTLAGLVGVVATGGPWMWQMWVHYESPLFPFYNTIFQSPYMGAYDLHDSRFLPKDFWLAFVTYPFHFLMESNRTLETPFRDPRWAVLSLGVIALGIQSVAARLRSLPRPEVHEEPDRRAMWMLLVFVGLSYAIWLKMFGIQRYLLPTELLVGPCMVGLVGLLWRGTLPRAVSLVLLGVLIVGLTKPPRHWPRIPWTGTWLEVEVPSLDQHPGAIVAILTNRPAGYVLPAFGEDVSFVPVLRKPFEGHLLWERMERLLRRPQSDLFVLIEPDKPLPRPGLDIFDEAGIEIDGTRCRPVVTQIERFDLCETRRRTPLSPGQSPSPRSLHRIEEESNLEPAGHSD